VTLETTVYIIDDDEAVRDSLAFLLEAAELTVRTYESAVQFLEQVSALGGGCVVTDIRMPEMTGLDLVRRLTASGSSLPVIVITGHGDVPLAVEAMRAGVVDFIEKPFDDEVMLAALRRALDISRSHVEEASERREISGRLARLSTRERQVLDGLVAGHANKVVAQTLGISPRTVEVYRANLMTKMRASSLSELVRMTLNAGR
jgi:two-component system, LuxR family, response regulator FixJ